MSIFTKYNRKSIQDRQIDTLIGLATGLAADGKVDQQEAEVLLGWLRRNEHSENPIVINLLQKLEPMFEDGLIDSEEGKEIFSLLTSITGDIGDLDELGKTSTLPLDDPEPLIEFPDKEFLFTGTFAFGTRKECQSVIDKLGGRNAKSVTKTVNYLVLGTYVSDSWIHESFGRKIEKAIEYRDGNTGIAIVCEASWLNAAGL